MSAIRQVIESRWAETDAVFVFPSKIAASFWQREAFQIVGQRVIRSRRFLYWDEFAEQVLRYPDQGRPVSKAETLLFAWSLLDENSSKPFLEALVPQAHADTSQRFLSRIASILPTLGRAGEVRISSREKRRDIEGLLARYRGFLRSHGLFEPSFSQPSIECGDRRYIILYPEVLSGFEELKGLLADCPRTEIVPISSLPASVPGTLRAFPNSIGEISWVLSSIEGLLDSGVAPERIALTVCLSEEIGERITVQAGLREIPLDFRRGKPVASYPEARVFRRIADCARTGFSLAAVKSLLLDRGLPFRAPDKARALVRFGERYFCAMNYKGRGARRDVWRENLAKASRAGSPSGGSIAPRCGSPSGGGLARKRDGESPGFSLSEIAAIDQLYTELKSRVEAVASAQSPGDLKREIEAFTNRFFDTDGLPRSRLDVFTFAIRTLNELSLSALGLGLSRVPSVLDLWLSILETTPYVPTREGGGIQVFPYKVSMGIAPDHHFIVNASQKGTLDRRRRYPFLTVDEEEDLADPEENLTVPISVLYASSGKDVQWSYSRRTFSDSELPPGFFVSSGTIVDQVGEVRDLYRSERDAWKDRGGVERIYPVQRQGIEQADRTVFRKKGADYSLRPVSDPEILKAVLARRSTETGLLRISPTSMETYLSCPFRFLFETVLGLRDDQAGMDMSPLDLGNLIHSIFKGFFSRVQEVGGPFRAAKMAEYERVMNETIDSHIAEYGALFPVPPSALWDWTTTRLRAGFQAFLQNEARHFDGYEVADLEGWLSEDLPDEGIRLAGKIDRRSRKGDSWVLIDYKRKMVPKKADIFGEEPTSFQMPFYARLMEANGMPLATAAYYSLYEEEYAFVVGGGGSAMASADQMAEASRDISLRAGEMAAGIREGRFTISAKPMGAGCRYCAISGLCRERYVLE